MLQKVFIGTWLALVLFFIHVKVIIASSSVIKITSSLQPGVDMICINETLTLACHTDQPSKDVTWHWANNQSHKGNNITVHATPYETIFTCVVSDNNGTYNKANITVIANGAPPTVRSSNFYRFLYLTEGSDKKLITDITSDLPLSDGSPRWYGFNRNLPESALVSISYGTDGTIRSTLKLYNLSYYDDSGEYISSASNKCGTTTRSIFIAVRKRSRFCFNDRVPPLISPPKDYTTVVGEYASFSCLFNGSVIDQLAPITSYWAIDYDNESVIITANTTDYRIAVYQTCSSHEHSCCQFISKLMVYNTTLSFNNATVKCFEFLQQVKQRPYQQQLQHSNNFINANAKFIVYTYPEVIEGPADVSAKATQNVQFKCEFEAPTATGVSIVVWLKDDFAVIQSSSHYNISMNPSVTDDGVGENTDHFISTLSILGVTNKDAGKYSCYCYYNTTMVTSTKSQYVISNVKSANLQIKSDDNKKSLSYTQLYAAVSAGTVVFIVLMTVWIISAIVYLRYRKRPQLVNLQEGYYDGDEYDEKQSLIQAAQDDYNSINIKPRKTLDT